MKSIHDAINDTVDLAIAAGAHKVTQVSAWTGVLAWLFSQNGIAMLGLIIATIGLLVQWYYRRKQDKRDQIEHEKRMALYE